MIILSVVFGLLLYFDYRINKRVIGAFLLVIGPYVAITIVNNLLAVNAGFYAINMESILVIIVSAILFFAGNVVGSLMSKNHNTPSNIERQMMGNVDIYLVKWYVLVVCLLRLFKLLFQFRSAGFQGMMANDFEMFAPSGLSGHLLISIKPLCGILFWDWLKDKKKVDSLLLVIFSGGMLASSFVKYHVITFVIILYLFACFQERKNYFRYAIIMVAFVVLFFMGNYFVGFVLRNIEVNNDFYFNHLWKYIAGGVVNINYVIEEHATIAMTSWQCVVDLFTSFIQMIGNAFLGTHSVSFFDMNLVKVSSIGEESNVVSIIGYLFAQTNIVVPCIMITLWGTISAFIYNKAQSFKGDIMISFASVYFTYNFLSFFSPFFRLSGSWEEMLWSVLIVWVFSLKIKYNKIVLRH